MNYVEAVRYLLSLGRELAAPTQAAAAKFDLENISVLAERLGRPERSYPSAHIAGTNGKGSTAAFLESIFRRAGFRTGLYTSPHLEKINERLRINGDEIGDEAFAQVTSHLVPLIEELLATGKLRAHPTYFECVTAMAFEYFAGERVEFGVFEVGLGGRLDATNILQPAITVITRIDFDHENFLGHSLPEIASEKAGILKPGVPVVMAPQRPEAREVILRRAAELKCPTIETEKLFQIDSGDMQAVDGCYSFVAEDIARKKFLSLSLSLRGQFQIWNALTAIAVAQTLVEAGFKIDETAVQEGIHEAHWPGRLERLQSKPAVYLDGAHNPSAARELERFIRENVKGNTVRIVYGALRDKAVDEIAGLLFPLADEVIFTEAKTSRAISASQLAEMAGEYASRFEVIPDAETALESVLAKSGPDDVVFVTGSLYLVGELRHYWKQRAQVGVR